MVAWLLIAATCAMGQVPDADAPADEPDKPSETTEVAPVPIAAAPLTPAQRMEMEHLLDDVKDARLDADRRRRAALILLRRDWPEATTALRRLLLATADRPTREAIQLAIADADRPDDSFITPLLDQLVSDDADARASAPAALARYDSADVTKKLTALAQDTEAKPDTRIAAIRALGGHRTTTVLATLAALTADRTDGVSEAADAALSDLTGRADIQPGGWRAYADRVKASPDHDWRAAWSRNLATAGARMRQAMAEQTRRLSEAYSLLYNESDEARRPALLVNMLADDTVELRLLAADLIERRVLDAQPIEGDLRTTMRGSLSDRSPRVRERVALLLRDLKDTDGADRAVRLLPDESDAAVKAAYLALMARVPRRDAVGPALAAMDDAKLRSAAAGVLVAAAEAELLSKAQAKSALAATRSQLKDNDTPDPALIRLLGRLGEAGDAKTLRAYLDHEQPTVRIAAAEQIAMGPWPLDPLMLFLDDEALGPVAIAAAGQRGKTAKELQALLGHEPEDTTTKGAWRTAVEAIAGHLSAKDVAAIDTWLTQQETASAMHERILVAAAAPNGNGGADAPDAAATEARRREATLRLADLHTRTNQPTKAKAALSRLADRADLSEAHRTRLAVAQVKLLLVQGLVDDAKAGTSAALDSDTPPSVEALTDVWLDAADRAIADDRPATAGKYAATVSELLRAQMSPESRARLDTLIATLKAAAPDPTDPTPTTPAPDPTPATP